MCCIYRLYVESILFSSPYMYFVDQAQVRLPGSHGKAFTGWVTSYKHLKTIISSPVLLLRKPKWNQNILSFI